MAHFDSSSSGVFIISVTPFDDKGSLDLDGTGRLIDFYLEQGVTGITILGMMGEASKLSASESRDFVARVCRRIDGRLPVVVGVSSPGFAAMAELTAVARGEGAEGVMVAPPSTLRTEAQVTDYFEMAAETLGDVPFVLQDFPLSTQVQISAGTILAIARRVPSMVMLKHEDWPGLNKITTLRNAEAAGGRRLSILTGNGGLFLPEELVRGADGAMTGFAFPEMMVRVCALAAEGRHDDAASLFEAYLPLVRYEQQPGVGLAVRKYVLHKRGVIGSSFIRKPGKGLQAEEIGEVERMIVRQARKLESDEIAALR